MEFAWVSDGGATPCKMPNGPEFDARTDIVEDTGGKIRTFFRVVDKQGDVRQAVFLAGGRREGRSKSVFWYVEGEMTSYQTTFCKNIHLDKVF